MKTVILGSGNVAYHLANALKNSNLKSKGIYARNKKAAREIQEKTGLLSMDSLDQNADLYIICVNDSSISSVSREITNPNALVVHTSGSMPFNILEGRYRKGCLYPLQTFSKTKQLDYSKIPFFIESEKPKDLEIIQEIAEKISPFVQEASFTKRKYIHLSAVFACNFTNHLITQSKHIADSNEIPFEYFLPLIRETFEKIQHIDPKDAQTGPAVRNDKRVLEAHRELLTDSIQLEIYDTLNKAIATFYNLK